MSAELFVVPRDQVRLAWPEIERCISRVDKAPWDVEDVLQELEEGRAQAWGMRDADRVLGFWITRIENSYTRKYGVVWITAGDGIDIGLPVYRGVIEPWFRSQGCEYIEIHGRKGWKRALPDYSEVAVVLRKDLNGHGTNRQCN